MINIFRIMVYLIIGIILLAAAVVARNYFSVNPQTTKKIKQTGIVLAVFGAILHMFRYFKKTDR